MEKNEAASKQGREIWGLWKEHCANLTSVTYEKLWLELGNDAVQFISNETNRKFCGEITPTLSSHEPLLVGCFRMRTHSLIVRFIELTKKFAEAAGKSDAEYVKEAVSAGNIGATDIVIKKMYQDIKNIRNNNTADEIMDAQKCRFLVVRRSEVDTPDIITLDFLSEYPTFAHVQHILVFMLHIAASLLGTHASRDSICFSDADASNCFSDDPAIYTFRCAVQEDDDEAKFCFLNIVEERLVVAFGAIDFITLVESQHGSLSVCDQYAYEQMIALTYRACMRVFKPNSPLFTGESNTINTFYAHVDKQEWIGKASVSELAGTYGKDHSTTGRLVAIVEELRELHTIVQRELETYKADARLSNTVKDLTRNEFWIQNVQGVPGQHILAIRKTSAGNYPKTLCASSFN